MAEQIMLKFRFVSFAVCVCLCVELKMIVILLLVDNEVYAFFGGHRKRFICFAPRERKNGVKKWEKVFFFRAFGPRPFEYNIRENSLSPPNFSLVTSDFIFDSKRFSFRLCLAWAIVWMNFHTLSLQLPSTQPPLPPPERMSLHHQSETMGSRDKIRQIEYNKNMK